MLKVSVFNHIKREQNICILILKQICSFIPLNGNTFQFRNYSFCNVRFSLFVVTKSQIGIRKIKASLNIFYKPKIEMKRFKILRTNLRKKFLQIYIYQEAVAIVSEFFFLISELLYPMKQSILGMIHLTDQKKIKTQTKSFRKEIKTQWKYSKKINSSSFSICQRNQYNDHGGTQ